MEVVRWVGKPGRTRFPIKRDQLASDLAAMKGDQIVFIQVKGGRQAMGGGTFPEARRAFEAFQFSVWTRQWIVAWPLRAREPRVIDCTVERS